MSINVASHGTTSTPATPAFVKQMEERRRESELRPRVHVTVHDYSGEAWVVAMMAYPAHVVESATIRKDGAATMEAARAAAMAGAAYRRLSEAAEKAAATLAAERAAS